MTELAQFLSEISVPLSPEPADEWIEGNVELTGDSEIKGRISFRWLPQQRFVLRAYWSDCVRRITALVSTQSTKTTTALLCLTWKIKNRPTPTAWYTDTEQSAKLDYKMKLRPYFDGCTALDDVRPTLRDKSSQSLIQFATMNLLVLGAHSKRNRERLSIQEVFIDEARNLKPGALAEIEGRFKTFRQFKRFAFSTAGRVMYHPETGEPIGDEFFIAFWNGTRHQFFWTCPHCGHKQTFRFGRKKSPLYPQDRECGGFVWDINEKTMPREDVYDFRELGKTVRYECENPACRHHFENQDKFALIEKAEAVQTNPMAGEDNISVHWWEAYMPWAQCDWPEIVKKFLSALVAMKRGNLAPMQVFVTDTLGEPWEDQIGQRAEEKEILKNCGEFSIGEEWPKETKRMQVIAVDNQHGFIKFHYGLYDQGGNYRLVDCGSLPTFGSLRDYQLARKVPDACVGIDVSYMPDDVYAACLTHGRWIHPPNSEPVWNGWLPLQGDEANEFAQRLAGVSVRSYWNPKTVDANIGKGLPRLIQRITWSKDHYRDQLYTYALKGKLGKYELPKNVPKDYIDQMQNVWKAPIVDATGQVIGHEWKEHGRHDHPDCACMSMVVADVRGVKSPV
jgi:hypothetical protein